MFALKRLRVTYTDTLYSRVYWSVCVSPSGHPKEKETSDPHKTKRNKFQAECTRHVLHYMQPCDCFPILVKLVLESMDKHPPTILLNEKAFPSGSLFLFTVRDDFSLKSSCSDMLLTSRRIYILR